MEILKTELDGVLILKPQVFGDHRGWFSEAYNKNELKKYGIDYDFIQDNHSFSAEKGTIRGLHYQNAPFAQAKLIRCVRGKIIDVAVDLRRGFPTYKHFVQVELSETNKHQLLIPRGYAHGFVTLTSEVEIQYKVDNIYAPQYDRSVRYDDPEIGIQWGVLNPVLSQKDLNAPLLNDCDCNFSLRVLVTGVNGQLGHDVIQKLQQERIECLGCDIQDFDITDFNATSAFINKYKPNVIVHCAAYTAVDRAEQDFESCHLVNSIGTKNIAIAAKEVDAKLIYISTDYVYGDNGAFPLNVDDNLKPQSVYAKTKLEGENYVCQNVRKHFIIRTSWVFGKNGNNFVKTMLKKGREHQIINVVSDQIGSPTYTVDLAKLIFSMMFSKAYGIYNASNEGFVSWYRFACEIFRSSNINIDVNPIFTKDYVSLAPRQLNSRLDKRKLLENGFDLLPFWEDALVRFLEEIKQ